MQWNIDTARPVYIQLIEHIQTAIVSGHYKPSDRLPSVRDLASEASVNPNTMQKALAELERVGLVSANRTSGRYITSDSMLIQKIRRQSAEDVIRAFLDRMNQLGFAGDETLTMVSEIVKEKTK